MRVEAGVVDRQTPSDLQEGLCRDGTVIDLQYRHERALGPGEAGQDGAEEPDLIRSGQVVPVGLPALPGRPSAVVPHLWEQVFRSLRSGGQAQYTSRERAETLEKYNLSLTPP